MTESARKRDNDRDCGEEFWWDWLTTSYLPVKPSG